VPRCLGVIASRNLAPQRFQGQAVQLPDKLLRHRFELPHQRPGFFKVTVHGTIF
jgi:hypothetical protein